MIKNDTCTELSKIPLGHNSHNGAVYSKINFKDEICNADVRWSSHAFQSLSLILYVSKVLS